MYRAIKIRLYPNKEQEQAINQLFGCYRFVYNYMLDLKQQEYKDNNKTLSLKDLSKYFYSTLRKDENYSWLKVQNTKVMKQSIRQMLTAYNRFFKLHTGFPKYKSKKDIQSAYFPIDAISRRNTFEERKITLTQSFKDIKFRCSKLYLARLQTYKNKIRSATISKTKSGKYFLSILIDIEESEIVKFKKTGKSVGLDLGVKDFVITSDGDKFENKHFLKKQENKIKKLQKQLSRKVKGSNNRNKQRIKIAKAFEHLVNQRENYIHAVINELLKNYDTIFMEDLNVSGMLKNHCLSKAIQEVGFYKFKLILQSKAMLNNKQVTLIDRYHPSSKICSHCGYKNKDLRLSDRFWTCLCCGTKHDRDINAARNILVEGQRIHKQSI
jgi:transposase